MKLKTPEEIELLKEGGAILASILERVKEKVTAGATVFEINQYAEALAKEHGARPAFKGYKIGSLKPFPSGLCVSINEEVVHGLGDRNIAFSEGDIVGIDMGIEYKKLYTDHAITIPVGNIDDKTKKLLKVTEQSLYKGIDVMKPGVSLYEVGKAIQNFVESNGFSVVRELIGHGVGHSVHEAPEIPNFYDPRMFRDVKLKTGMVLAVEPMVNVGDWPISTLEDGWTVVTTDGSLSAHFEHTVAITSNGVEILTQV